jgi:tight adherence protein C
MDSMASVLSGGVATGEGNAWVFILLVAITVFVFGAGVSVWLMRLTDPVRRRLDALAPERKDDSGFTQGFAEWVQRCSKYLMPSQGKERDEVSKQLRYAGFRSAKALPTFYGIKVLLAIGLGTAVLLGARFLPQLTSSAIFFYASLSAAAGLVLPSTVLRHLVEKRHKALRNGFPDALDMLVICVESGLGLNAALQRVADELQFSHPELASELALINAETRAGVEREAALRGLAERTGLDDIRGLVSLLIQTLRFGTSVADTLRVYSEEFRDKRMQRAEEQAAKVGTKLIFPLVFCLFPSFFVVAIGPAVIRIIDVFAQLTTNVVK